MKKKMVGTIIIIILTLLFGIGTNTYAAETDTFTITMEPNKTQLKQGETVEVKLYIDNINVTSGENGIGAFTAKLNYDSNIFENATSVGSDTWDNPSIQPTGEMAGVKSDGVVVSTRQLVGTITLTAKQQATLGSTTLSITDVQGANGDLLNPAVSGVGSQSILTIQSLTVTPEPNSTDQNQTTGQGNSTSNSLSNKDNTTTDKTLAKTGTSSIILISLLGATIAGMISYILYKRYKI